MRVREPLSGEQGAGPPRFRLAIFDFDGTLADSFPAFVELIERAALRFRFRPPTADDLDELRRTDIRTLMRRYQISRWKLPRIARFMRKESATKTPALFPGIRELLILLHRNGVQVAIVSSNAETNVRAALGPELSSLVQRFECGVSLFGKARRLRRVLRLLGCSAREAVYVGDELRDADATEEAGVAFAAVSWGFSHPDALREREPFALCADVDELAIVLAPSTDPGARRIG